MIGKQEHNIQVRNDLSVERPTLIIQYRNIDNEQPNKRNKY